MANTLKEQTNLWVLDSTGAFETRRCKVQAVAYKGTNAGDDLIVHDSNGDTAFHLVQGSVNVIEFDGGRWFFGLTVDTIDSGTGFVYLM